MCEFFGDVWYIYTVYIYGTFYYILTYSDHSEGPELPNCPSGVNVKGNLSTSKTWCHVDSSPNRNIPTTSPEGQAVWTLTFQISFQLWARPMLLCTKASCTGCDSLQPLFVRLWPPKSKKSTSGSTGVLLAYCNLSSAEKWWWWWWWWWRWRWRWWWGWWSTSPLSLSLLSLLFIYSLVSNNRYRTYLKKRHHDAGQHQARFYNGFISIGHHGRETCWLSFRALQLTAATPENQTTRCTDEKHHQGIPRAILHKEPLPFLQIEESLAVLQ